MAHKIFQEAREVVEDVKGLRCPVTMKTDDSAGQVRAL
jgi:hypothetical protein